MKTISKVSIFILLFLLASYAIPANASTIHFGAADRQLSSATTEVADGYYSATTLHAVDNDLAAGNIKKEIHIFGIIGTYEGAGGGSSTYGLPKTCQQPGLPSGVPLHAGDDCSYASPETYDVGYPRGKLTWANYNTARFTDNGDGTVTDNATGLMWEQKTPGGSGGLHDTNNTYTWTYYTGPPSAFDVFIAGLNTEGGTGFAGHNDWRLPNIFELRSIVDLGRGLPAINPVFVNTQSSYAYYWSSTSYAPSTTNAWDVDFTAGASNVDSKQYPGWAHYCRAVRGGE